MIRSENLRSGYIQDDVEEYLYELLPERDAVVREMEDYAAQNRVSDHRAGGGANAGAVRASFWGKADF